MAGIVMLLCGCIHSTTSPAGSTEALPAGAGTLNVGITPDDPPLVYRDKGAITGLEVALAKGLAAYTGRKLVLVQLEWEEQIPALLDGDIDIIMSGMTITNARKYRVAFSEPYMVTSQIPLVRREDYNRFSYGFPALLNPAVKVGTVKGTTGDFFIEERRAKGSSTRFSSANQGAQALMDKTIDVFVYDLPANLYYGAHYSNKGLKPVVVPLTREYIAWAIHPRDSDMLKNADGYLQSLKDRNELAPMIKKWIPFYENLL